MKALRPPAALKACIARATASVRVGEVLDELRVPRVPFQPTRARELEHLDEVPGESVELVAALPERGELVGAEIDDVGRHAHHPAQRLRRGDPLFGEDLLERLGFALRDADPVDASFRGPVRDGPARSDPSDRPAGTADLRRYLVVFRSGEDQTQGVLAFRERETFRHVPGPWRGT